MNENQYYDLSEYEELKYFIDLANQYKTPDEKKKRGKVKSKL